MDLAGGTAGVICSPHEVVGPGCEVTGISPAGVETADEVVETTYERPEPSTDPANRLN